MHSRTYKNVLFLHAYVLTYTHTRTHMQVALVQPIMLNRPDIAKHLCNKHCANGLIGPKGVNPVTMSRLNPTMHAILTRSTGKAAKRAAKRTTASSHSAVPDPTAVCAGCGKTSEELQRSLQRCTRCYSACFCSKECLKANWKRHKPNCRKKQEQTIVVRPYTNPGFNHLVSFTSSKSSTQWKGENSTPSVPPGSFFNIKVQTGGSADAHMLVYNKNRDFCMHIDRENCEKKAELFRIIRNFTPFLGLKAYFKAKIKNGKLIIHTNPLIKDW